MENAIEISYKALEENQHRNVYLLSQMIHNQEVNDDLVSRGIRFIMDTDGTQFIPWNEIHRDDVVIIPAFGTTLEIEQLLLDKGVEIQQYNTTCPFVEKVWNRSEKLATEGYTIVIHGKPNHEETRATFSHSSDSGASIVVRDMKDAERLGAFILGEISAEQLAEEFKGKFSTGFDPTTDLRRIGVVNQTTMLATETQAIADYLKEAMITRHGAADAKFHFADTRDTLCYATNDNQESTYSLLRTDADLAIVVGGYNSSNTSHLVELCQEKFPTYFINSEREIRSQNEIHYFDVISKSKKVSFDFLPNRRKPLKIILTSGASCPDTLVDRVMLKIVEFFPTARRVDEVLDLEISAKS